MYEDAAAAILDRSAGTLRNWRSSGAGSALPFYRSGRTGRVRYRLTDLAELLEVQRDRCTIHHDPSRLVTRARGRRRSVGRIVPHE